MLNKNQEKFIKSLHSAKGRKKSGFCLIEGKKNIQMAENWIDFIFSKKNSKNFDKLITTKNPQNLAAVAKIPNSEESKVLKNNIIVALDGVQDPGNIGTICRMCLGFSASLILIECADLWSPKVIRASAGAVFKIPFLKIKREEAKKLLTSQKRIIYRLEKSTKSAPLFSKKLAPKLILIAGSEGYGIKLNIDGESLEIPHNKELESLNVASAIAITLAFLKLK